MDKTTKKISKEIEVIERIINGYLATDPFLAEYELDSISIKPKEKVGIENNPKVADTKNFMVPPEIENESNFSLKRARCCMRQNGKKYFWHGSGPCPNGDQECQ